MLDPHGIINGDLIPLEKAAERLGISRATMWRRVQQLGLTVRSGPVDRRLRLLSWTELVAAMKPTDDIVVASGSQMFEHTEEDYGSVLEQETGHALRVMSEERPAARARMLAERVIDTFSGASNIGAAIIQGEGEYASRLSGPFPIRDCFPTIWYQMAAGCITRLNGGLSSIWDIGKGTRIADISSVIPGMKAQYLALLAWVQVDPREVVFVPFDSWTAGIRAVTRGEADLAFAMPVSEAALQAEQAPNGIKWLDMNPEASDKDREGAARHRAILPGLTFRRNQEGVRSSLGVWGLWFPGNYAARYVHADADPDFVYSLVRWRNRQHNDPVDATLPRPSSTLPFVKSALPEVFIPLHDGAIRYFKECGIWSTADDARQEYNLRLQNGYLKAWRQALSIADLLSVAVKAGNRRWLSLWQECKKDLPPVGPTTDEYVAAALPSLNHIWHKPPSF